MGEILILSKDWSKGLSKSPWPQATCITQDRSSTNPENSWVSAQSKTSSNPFMDVGPATHNGSFAQLKFKD